MKDPAHLKFALIHRESCLPLVQHIEKFRSLSHLTTRTVSGLDELDCSGRIVTAFLTEEGCPGIYFRGREGKLEVVLLNPDRWIVQLHNDSPARTMSPRWVTWWLPIDVPNEPWFEGVTIQHARTIKP